MSGAVEPGYAWMVRAVADKAQQEAEGLGEDARYYAGIEAALRWACGDGYADDALRQLVRDATDPDDAMAR